MVLTTSPNFSLYNIVVFPAPSRPSIQILAGRGPKNRSMRVEIRIPMTTTKLLQKIELVSKCFRRKKKYEF